MVIARFQSRTAWQRSACVGVLSLLTACQTLPQAAPSRPEPRPVIPLEQFTRPKNSPSKSSTSPPPQTPASKPIAKPTPTAKPPQTRKPAQPTLSVAEVTQRLQQAEDKAVSATSVAKTAQTREDWSLVQSQWQRAIAILQAIPGNSPQRQQVQQRLAEYRRGLAAARQQSSNPTAAIAQERPVEGGGIPLIAGAGGGSDSQAIATLTSVNQAQQSFLAQNKRFATSATELKAEVQETPQYRFNLTANGNQQATIAAIAKTDQLPSYSGVVVAQGGAAVSLICGSDRPSRTPPTPTVKGSEISCPAGSRPF